MMEILAGVTILIPAVMALRWLTGGKISMRLRYGLWLVVALRLMIPVNIGSSIFSVMNPAGRAASFMAEAVAGGGIQVRGRNATGGTDMERHGVNGPDALPADGGAFSTQTGYGADDSVAAKQDMYFGAEGNSAQTARYPAASGQAIGTPAKSVRPLLIIWIVGAVIVGGYILGGQLRFISYLHRKRKEILPRDLPKEWAKRLSAYGIKVYRIKGLPGPCMAGNNIYISPELCGEEHRLKHILAHEYAHARQNDTLWAFVRSMLCAVWWFHPLVWLAAYEAKQDSELACDEQAVRLLGEKERFAYGKTLLDLVFERRGPESCAGVVLTMKSSAKRMKERVSMIAGKRRYSRAAAGVLTAAVVFLCGCAFTGAMDNAGDSKTGEGNQTKQEAAGDSKTVQDDQAADKREKVTDRESVKGQQAEAAGQDTVRLSAQETYGTEASEAGTAAFDAALRNMTDETLSGAGRIDPVEYYRFLYEGAQCPMEDGTWYLAARDEQLGIDFYGLYTGKYGCRGIKILIDGDVNTFDMPWNPLMTESGIQVLQAEQEEDGSLRTFIFKTCLINDSRREIWNLYVADRYDTGTIELSCFSMEEYGRQFREMAEFVLDREKERVDVVCDKTVIGTIDISGYGDDTVEDVLWYDSAAGFLMEGENADKHPVFVTGIGLKVEGTDEIRCGDLSLITCPVDIGTWGERSFELGNPVVETKYVSMGL